MGASPRSQSQFSELVPTRRATPGRGGGNPCQGRGIFGWGMVEGTQQVRVGPSCAESLLPRGSDRPMALSLPMLTSALHWTLSSLLPQGGLSWQSGGGKGQNPGTESRVQCPWEGMLRARLSWCPPEFPAPLPCPARPPGAAGPPPALPGTHQGCQGSLGLGAPLGYKKESGSLVT